MADNQTFFRDMILSDAVSHQRSINTFRETAIAQLVKRMDNLEPEKVLELLKATDSTSTIANYIDLVRLADLATSPKEEKKES